MSSKAPYRVLASGIVLLLAVLFAATSFECWNEEAAEAFSTLIERYPNFTIARFHLGVIYARQGHKDKAEAEFRRVLMKNPEHAAARFYVSR